MITRLYVRDFVLIEEAELEFGPGLTVLTGETGAGKSLLLGSFSQLFAQRASAALIRRGAKDATIEAAFRTDERLRRKLGSIGIRAEEEIVLVRQLRHDRPSRAFVNGQRLTATVLSRLGSWLIELHGQREQERFRSAEVQRDLLDLYAGAEELRRRVADAYSEAQHALQDLQSHRARVERTRSEEDWLRYQLSEIESVDPKPDEEEQLRVQLEDARRNRQQRELLDLAEYLLNGREGAVLESLEELDYRLRSAGLEDLEDLSEEVSALLQAARQAYRRVRSMGSGAEEASGDEERLAERLSQIETLKRKHRRSLGGVLELAEEIRARLRGLEEAHAEEERLLQILRDRLEVLMDSAQRLSEKRRKAAASLGRRIEAEMRRLGMEGGSFAVTLRPRCEEGHEGSPEDPATWPAGPKGSEDVEFLVETNPGEGMRPMGSVASGGEISRLALALRVAIGPRGFRRPILFDEIDAGVGGRAARVLAERLRQVAEHRQVLLVTHLPVIAAAGTRHLRIEKHSKGGRTMAVVKELSEQERLLELARMLSGDASDPEARRHAKALLARG